MASPTIRVAGLLLALLAAGLGGGCRRSEPPARHLLLVTLDTVRADRLGAYGRADAGTPWLDGVAARGVRVERAYCQAPITLPSHLSILTGLHPPRHGVRNNGETAVAPGVRTLAERLAAAGFHTAAAVGGYPLAARFPAARGFASYDDRFVDADRPAALERPAASVVDAALGLLGGRGDRRTFLWAHVYDPHDPYEPPSPFRERYAADPYQGEIAAVDAALQRLEAGFRAAVGDEPYLVVVLADHGESLGEHGEETHGFFLYEPSIRIPFLLAGPGVPRGGTVAGPVQGVDVVPTVLGLLGLPPADGLDGRAIPLSDPQASTGPVYAETELPARNYGWSPLATVVRGTLKYIEAPRAELYDLGRDPRETSNQLRERGDDAAALAALVAGVRGAAEARPPTAVGEVDPRLASLGYVGTGKSAAPGDAAADPKDRLAVYRAFTGAARAIERGDGAAALRDLDQLLPAHDSAGVRTQRAAALRLMGRPAEGLDELRRAAVLDASFAGIDLERARCALLAGRGAEAAGAVERHLARVPDDAEALLLRGVLKEAAGAFVEAEADFVAALRSNPGMRTASLKVATARLQRGDLAGARAWLEQHLQRHPADDLARGLLGELRRDAR